MCEGTLPDMPEDPLLSVGLVEIVVLGSKVRCNRSQSRGRRRHQSRSRWRGLRQSHSQKLRQGHRESKGAFWALPLVLEERETESGLLGFLDDPRSTEPEVDFWGKDILLSIQVNFSSVPEGHLKSIRM